MSKESSLIFLGIFVIVVPFLGIPETFRTFLFVVSGISISFLALLIYARERLLEQAKVKRRARSVSPRQGGVKTRPHDASTETTLVQE
ncbi:MAG: hypothetical protein HYS73_00705 [Parcubacteria group bacterium]|nr:hypothetical protein [Parcubacteria group bacterium]